MEFWYWWAVIAVFTGFLTWDAVTEPGLVRERVYTLVMATGTLIVTATFWSGGGVWLGP